MTTAKVYEAIAAITHRMGAEGISKTRKNAQQGYNFRGIDDVLNALSPMLSESHLCILPCALERECVERQSAKGATLFYVTVKVRFDFISAEDGSKHEVVTYGEAMDSADKATNKAMSAAYKYAAILAFCIPTEGDNDADATTHEVAARRPITEERPGLSASAVADFLAGIETADIEGLKPAFQCAYRAAEAAGDEKAKGYFVDAKDKRKSALGAQMGTIA